MPNKLPTSDMQAATLVTVRAFPTIVVSIYHVRWVNTGLGQVVPVIESTAYHGEAIFYAGGQNVVLVAAGFMDVSEPTLVLPTKRAIRQKDFVPIKGVQYEVTAILDWALGGTVLTLKVYQQGS